MARQSAVTVKQTEPILVAFLAKTGSFDQMGAAIGSLYQWLGAQGYTPAGPPRGTFYNAPGEVLEEELAWKVCAPIAGEVAPHGPDDQGYGVKRVEPHQVASVNHIGAYDQVPATYAALGGWIAENGYQIVGPSTEIWVSDPDVTPVAELLTEIQFPVVKA
jgi:effector-binding domain-containing protein